MSDVERGVVIAGGDHRATLAVARSLGRAGMRVSVVGTPKLGIVAASRHVAHRVSAPSPRDDPHSYVERVIETARRRDAQLVIPTDDNALIACELHRAEVEAVTRLAAPPSEAVQNVLDKRANLETARRLGIPCPSQFDLTDREQVDELIAHVGFPLVLKNPGLSGGSHPSRFGFRAVVARNRSELDGLLDEHCGDGTFPLVQQMVSGSVYNLCCFAVGGTVVAALQYRSIRRRNGQGIHRLITATDAGLLGHATALLDVLRWEGVAHLGFFVRKHDAQAWYMETNGRFWGSTEGSIRAGWDFPRWTYDYFITGRVPDPPPLRVGSRTCWHLGDLVALADRLRGSDAPTGVATHPGRAIVDYLRAFGPGVYSDVFRIDDPLPAFFEYLTGIPEAMRSR